MRRSAVSLSHSDSETLRYAQSDIRSLTNLGGFLHHSDYVVFGRKRVVPSVTCGWVQRSLVFWEEKEEQPGQGLLFQIYVIEYITRL